MNKKISLESLLENVGTRIRSLRNAQGLTIEELGEQTDYSKGYVANIERSDVGNISLGALNKIANALHTNVIALLVNAAQKDGDDLARKDHFEALENEKEKSKRKFRRALYILETKLSNKKTLEEKRVKLAEMVINLVEFCD